MLFGVIMYIPVTYKQQHPGAPVYLQTEYGDECQEGDEEQHPEGDGHLSHGLGWEGERVTD